MNMLTFAPMKTDKVRLRISSMDDHMDVLQVFSVFFHSALVLPYVFLDMTLKFFSCKNGKTIRLNTEQVNFSKELFKHVKNFTATLSQNTISWLVP